MELQLSLALPTNPSKLVDLNSRAYHHKSHKKRTFSQLLDHAPQTSHTHVLLPTLSLLPLTPNHHHDDDHHHHSQSSSIAKNDEEETVVGWPPVNYWRKKLRLDHNCGDEVVGNNDHMIWVDHHHGHGSVGMGGSNTLYVKVKMEGMGIARKVDLCMHQSFQTLKETLMDMFGKCHQQSNSYELAYQDKEGDWLLAQDVPWRSFVRCAQRLKLVKNGG